MKQCTYCGLEKNESEFPIRKDRGTRRAQCRQCGIDESKAWRVSNMPRQLAMNKAWQESNREKYLALKRAYRLRNLEKVRAGRARHRSGLRKATPSWSNAFFVQEAYDLIRRRSKATGIQWSVDHIVPLNNESVCGLHSHTNIQVIPFCANQSKGNRSWPNM